MGILHIKNSIKSLNLDYIIVNNLLQISKKLIDFVKFIEEIKEKNVTLISIDEKFNNKTETGHFLLSLMYDILYNDKNLELKIAFDYIKETN